jgi:hypothetical protein
MKRRSAASAVLREFNKSQRCDGPQRVTLRKIDSVLQFFRSGPKEAGSALSSRHETEIELCRYNIATVALLSIVARQSEHGHEILGKDFPANDSNLCGFLANISNTAQAALLLVINGLDTQARVLLRTLDERIYQAIILFHSAQDYKIWHAGESSDDARSAHYQLFSRKGRLQKKLRAIEEEYLSSEGDLNELVEWRKEQDEFYSMAVHGSMAAVMVGSWAFAFEGGNVTFPNVFGRASSASTSTLRHLLFQLHHFNFLFPAVLKDVHGWEASKDDDMELAYLAFSALAHNLSLSWIAEGEPGA